MSEHQSKPIGAINGGYSILFRLGLLTYPLLLTALIGFFTWTVVNIHGFQIWRAGTDASRFSSGDWVKAKELLDAKDINFDKRISLIEEAYRKVADAAIAAQINSAANKVLLEEIKAKVTKP